MMARVRVARFLWREWRAHDPGLGWRWRWAAWRQAGADVRFLRAERRRLQASQDERGPA